MARASICVIKGESGEEEEDDILLTPVTRLPFQYEFMRLLPP